MSRAIPSAPWPALAVCAALALSGAPAAEAAPAHPFGNRTFIEAVKRLRPSVVHIRVKPRDATGKTVFGFFGRERKEKELPRFDLGEGVPPGQFNVGSGIVVSPDGYILTNHHVVKSAEEIHVRLHDGEELTAHLVGKDDKTDLALIKVEAKKPLSPAALGNSDAVEVGEWVVAIGSPFGLTQSVSVGVVSAKGRNLGEGPYDDFLQTDASINPGSSGGPLGNSRGEVIGINTAIFSQGRRAWSLGIGFAIPVNQAKAVIDDLRHRGYPVRGRLGATLGEVPADVARRLGLGRGRGARLVEVVRGGPAHRAGLRRGDVVTKFDGKTIITWESLARLAARARPESEVEVAYYRGGSLRSARVRMGGRPDAPFPARANGGDPIGMKVEALSPRLARRFGLKATEGLVVSAVVRHGPAQRGGVRPGDEIIEVNNTPVRTMKDYDRALKRARGENSILLLLRRGGSNIFAALRIN